MFNLVQENEISALPLSAVVAFAARCARKVQQLYQKTGLYSTNIEPQKVKQTISQIECAINFAEKTAQSILLTIKDQSILLHDIVNESAICKHKAIDDVKRFVSHEPTSSPGDSLYWYDRELMQNTGSLLAAANSARACEAAEQAQSSAKEALKKNAFGTIRAAYQACKAASCIDEAAINESHWEHDQFIAYNDKSIREEFELLFNASKRENWTDNTPVSPSFFSPDEAIERQVMLAINDLCVKLCHLIAQNEKALDQVEWRLLEQIVATALQGIGFGYTPKNLII
jgi:hypothetical protein